MTNTRSEGLVEAEPVTETNQSERVTQTNLAATDGEKRQSADRRQWDRRATPPFCVVVADPISETGLRPLSEDPRFEVVSTANGSGEVLANALGRAVALIVRSRTRVTPELLDSAENLRVIGRAGVGVDNIDLDAATERGIAVINAPEGNTVSAAELTLALMLSAARRVAAADRSVRALEWTRSRFGGMELRGKVLGLVGAGRIGGEVARRARAFGMSVLVYDPYLAANRVRELGGDAADLPTVLETADVISLHVPLTDSTVGMIGRAELETMKPTAILINVARGGVVDEEALVEALRAGTISGAALDVYAAEPLEADSPLREAPNLVLTPHLGASTAEAQELVATEIAEGIRRALVDGDLSRAVNAPQVGGEALKRLHDLLSLAGRLGKLACGLAPAPAKSVEVRYSGSHQDAPRPVTQAVLAGILEDVVGRDRVNFVSAGHLAEERGIDVTRAHSPSRADYGELLEVVLHTDAGTTSVAGALLGPGHPRLVRIEEYGVDIVPSGAMIILRNRDVPGVIGSVGTVLGSLGYNIAGYHQSRRSAGGEAMAVVSVDGPLDRSAIARLEAVPDVISATSVELPED